MHLVANGVCDLETAHLLCDHGANVHLENSVSFQFPKTPFTNSSQHGHSAYDSAVATNSEEIATFLKGNVLHK